MRPPAGPLAAAALCLAAAACERSGTHVPAEPRAVEPAPSPAAPPAVPPVVAPAAPRPAAPPAAAPKAPAADTGVVLVAVTITPGKPGAPSEVVEASLAAGRARLRLARLDGGRPLAEEESDLSSGEFDSLLRLVEAKRLTEFEPRAREGVADDFGSRRLRIDRGSGSGRATVRNVEWTGELVNGDAVDPLIRRLAELARAHAKSVELYYFPHD